VNVSTGGLAVEIVAEGEVRHAGQRTPREAGVRFSTLEPASLIAIHSLVGRYSS